MMCCWIGQIYFRIFRGSFTRESWYECLVARMGFDMKKFDYENSDVLPLSVIVPVYNVEKYLSRCLDSLLWQTKPVQEIICVDDGSTDRSGSILDSYAK